MTNTPASLTAPAKINLHLRILGIRKDGYHELRTLFFAVDVLSDLLEIEPGHDEHFYMRCPANPDLECASNLIYKAWKLFGQATGFQPGIFVTLTKRIPMGGGLGGGSSDCATLLRWLNDNAGNKALSHDDLISLAAILGADVPFFLMNGPAWAEGIGEILTPANIDLTGMTLVLACPDVHVDTLWAYKQWDRNNGSASMQESLTTPSSDTKKPSPVSALTVVNDFEAIVFAKYPILRKTKEKLIKNGAVAAAMSGSGASLFGLFRDNRSGMSAAKSLEKDGIMVFVQTM
ncbi:MAG: 4-(cytidine 5'-diphospho)-2-C-methyl-D-erythritol kinase [Pseudodesulfovibrio sp.]|nr:4-(cytidine 5'-diphospho)-2-C-methyl-D-erythritol kinase [Pseudodesulfovibrio sp.]